MSQSTVPDPYPAPSMWRPSLPELACDVVIVGGGVAGLTVALSLPADLRVVLVTKSALGESNTRYAQGGLAAAVGLDDTPELHWRDTLAAGAGLVDEQAARVLVEEAPEAVAWLIRTGAQFDERPDDSAAGQSASARERALAQRYALGREAAHSRRRVLHAHGDATGAEIERALVAAARARTSVLEHTRAVDLLVEDGRCRGVVVARHGTCQVIRAQRATVLANGGAGQLWLRTSNPVGATADGVAMAWRAGAMLADLEFVQFHPTVLVPPREGGDAFLISEAVRGEGAYLRNAAGERFMPRYHPDAELAPRDVVARSILNEMLATGSASAFLDLRHLPTEAMRLRFPSIAAACAEHGLDLARDLIPVAPAAHYFMGGVAVDTSARTSLAGLFAVGEVACTGVHGANRLASNSLLEGLVFGRQAAHAIATDVPPQTAPPERVERAPSVTASASPLRGAAVEAPIVEPAMHLGDTSGPTRWALRRAMWEHVSLRRDDTGLAAAQETLRALASGSAVDAETGAMLVVAQLIVAAARARRESRGGHFRTDYPAPQESWQGQHTLVLGRGAEPARREGDVEQSTSFTASHKGTTHG